MQIANAQTVQLGDLVAAAYDGASRLTDDRRVRAGLVAVALRRMLPKQKNNRLAKLLANVER